MTRCALKFTQERVVNFEVSKRSDTFNPSSEPMLRVDEYSNDERS